MGLEFSPCHIFSDPNPIQGGGHTRVAVHSLPLIPRPECGQALDFLHTLPPLLTPLAHGILYDT